MRRAIIPGSFDPITLGHLDIIERSSKLFDEVIVVIMKNSSKTTLFSEEERKDMIEHDISKFDNVRVEIGEGLTIVMAEKLGACAIVRGIRSVSDYDYEQNIAMVNSMLALDVETVFLLRQLEYAAVSSSVVKELASYLCEHNPIPFVSEYVKERLKEKLR